MMMFHVYGIFGHYYCLGDSMMAGNRYSTTLFLSNSIQFCYCCSVQEIAQEVAKTSVTPVMNNYGIYVIRSYLTQDELRNGGQMRRFK